MCGIAGIIHLDPHQAVDLQTVKKMTSKLSHRGPDDEGFFGCDNIGFGFKRLSIVGIQNGNQPLFSEDRSVVLICNGEIFNYIELRNELRKKGHRFYSDTDVEVIIALYREYGFDFFDKINGQFAFALFDRNKQMLFAARDHVGINPFYYTNTGASIVFASEIKALLEHPAVEKRVDLTGVDQIMTFPGLVSPRTAFENIRSLPSGHFLTVAAATVKVAKYWDLEFPRSHEKQYDQPDSFYEEKLDALLTESIRLRLRADVPVGFYVSGGLDSSLVAAKAAGIAPGNFHSFSIDFTEKAISEKKYQQIVTNRLRSQHHEIVFDSGDITSNLRKVIYHSEHPLKESYNTASFALSRLVRDNGIKVILTGEGADELFAGYVGYKLDTVKDLRRGDALNKAERDIRHKLWGDPDFFYERNYSEFSVEKNRLYSPRLNESFASVDCLNFPLVDTAQLERRHLMHKRSYIDFKLRLSDHLIADHGDKMVMANSVEARYPFLDKDLIAFVYEIPPGLMIRDMEEKYILKRIAKKYLPESIINREKFSFVAPGSDYLLKRSEWINDLLSPDRIRRQGYFDHRVVEDLRVRYSAKDFSLYLPFEIDYLFPIISFSIFLEEFGLPGL
jgi:asparagine synthase (glutamine-hydrolysing)